MTSFRSLSRLRFKNWFVKFVYLSNHSFNNTILNDSSKTYEIQVTSYQWLCRQDGRSCIFVSYLSICLLLHLYLRYHMWRKVWCPIKYHTRLNKLGRTNTLAYFCPTVSFITLTFLSTLVRLEILYYLLLVSSLQPVWLE